MKGIIFCSFILVWLINVFHCKHYLVEVDDDQMKNNVGTLTDKDVDEEVDVSDMESTGDDTEDEVDVVGSNEIIGDKKERCEKCKSDVGCRMKEGCFGKKWW